jgi:hypothetical protein
MIISILNQILTFLILQKHEKTPLFGHPVICDKAQNSKNIGALKTFAVIGPNKLYK